MYTSSLVLGYEILLLLELVINGFCVYSCVAYSVFCNIKICDDEDLAILALEKKKLSSLY